MKKKFVLASLVVSFGMFLIPTVYAEGVNLPGKDDQGMIKLTEDVNLAATFKISEEENVIIDLAGHSINYNSENSSYAINNLGTLKIIDSSNGNGKIVCTQPTGSCVRNVKSMEIDGVSIESNWLTVKNDELGNLTVKNSKITAKRVDQPSVAIQNWGKATVDNCNIIGDGEGTIAISDLSYTENGIKYSSEITVKNSRLNAPYAVDSRVYDSGETTQKIIFENIIVESGNIRVESGATFVSDSKENTLNAIKNATTGSTIIVSDDFTATDLAIPEGVNIELGENSKLEKVVGADGKISFIKKEEQSSVPTVEDKKDNIKNPETSDINLYLLLSIIAVCGSGIIYATRKRFN